jgi:hypothetical protein
MTVCHASAWEQENEATPNPYRVNNTNPVAKYHRVHSDETMNAAKFAEKLPNHALPGSNGNNQYVPHNLDHDESHAPKNGVAKSHAHLAPRVP